MGLAERFKTSLDKKDIFTKNEDIKNFEKDEIRFISTPVTNETSEKCDCTTVQKRETFIVSEEINAVRVSVINKLKSLPYREEFNALRLKNMIISYFNAKTKKSGKEYSKSEVENFVKSVLDAISDINE